MTDISKTDIRQALENAGQEASSLYQNKPADYKGRTVTPEGVIQSSKNPHYVDIANIAARNTQGNRILDVGMAYGFYGVVLKTLFNFEVYGIDHPVNVPVYCRFPIHQGISVLPCDLYFDRIPFSENTFDTAILSDVIEHLLIPAQTIFEKVSTVLKKEGRLILSTPNFASLENIVSLAKGRNPTAPFSAQTSWEEGIVEDKRTHPREYTLKEIKDALNAAGFVISRVYMRMKHSDKRLGLKTKILKAAMYSIPRYRERLLVVATKS